MSDRPLHYRSLLEASEMVARREVSVGELLEAELGRIGQRDGELHSYFHVAAEYAADRAGAMQAELDCGQRRGPLHGIPVAVKDLCDTTFAPTTAGMAIRKDYWPTVNAAVVDRLERAGAIILGKLATTEGALGSHHPEMAIPVNPWNAAHWAGASSSGSGVATAAGLCYAALGTDTGGSIRAPSMANGLTGVKPTFGRVSNFGIFPLGSTYDCVGPMARTAGDAAAVLQAIAGHDPRDPTSSRVPVADYLSGIGLGISGLRIGVDPGLGDGVDAQIQAVLDTAAAVFADLGAQLVEVRLPFPGAAIKAFATLIMGEAAISHAATFPAQRERYGPGLRAMLEAAPKVDPIRQAEAHLERVRLTARIAALFHDVDLLLIPALPDPVGPGPTNSSTRMTHFAAPINMAGNPSITLQGGFDRLGLPIGFQLVGKHFCEDLLLRAGHAFQQVTPWHTMHPPEPDRLAA
ncbi:MAG TPA: amidase [Novosphingobium sp.]|nr:amidase [Novosphingobium sp.]